MQPAILAQACHRHDGTAIGLCGLALIVVVEATHFRHHEHSTMLWRLDGASFRAIHRQRQVRAPRVVIGKGVREDAPEVVRTQDDHVVQALAANTPDETLLWFPKICNSENHKSLQRFHIALDDEDLLLLQLFL